MSIDGDIEGERPSGEPVLAAIRGCPTVPTIGGRMFVFKELVRPDGGPGRTIGFTDVDIRPRSYAELASAQLHKSVTIPLDMYNGRIVDTDVEGIDTSKYAHFTTVLESPFTSRAIGLVRGGWLPSSLAANKAGSVVLVDRNVVTEIVSRFENGVKVGAEPDFLDVFADDPVRINPLLYAMEGNARAIPDADLVRAQLDEVVAKLQKALPKAVLMVGSASLTGVLGLIEDSRASTGRKEQFLLQIAPSLTPPTARRNVDGRWTEILRAADSCGVPRNSLVVLAALSSVAVPNGMSPAKRLLKFRNGYNSQDAYNALADLRSLEVLIHLFGLFPDEPIQLCTADRSLALFWCGIQAADFERDGAHVTFSMTPIPDLLPDKLADRWQSDLERVH